MTVPDGFGVPELPDILDVLPAAVVLIGADGLVAGWNAAAETLYGHARADVVGAPVLDVLFDADDQAAAHQLLAGVTEGRRWEGDSRVRRRDGAFLVSSFRLIPTGGGAAWIATDGMDQGLAEQERSVLLSAEHAARATAEEALGMLEAVLGATPVSIAVFDLDLRYVRVNDAYAELSGRRVEEHVGGTLGDVVPIQEEVAADLRRTIEGGQSIVGRVVELPQAAGAAPGTRYFSVSYFPVRTAGGALVGVGLSGVEITQLKQAEAERLVLLRRAEDARQRLSILATASSVLTSTMDLDELLGGLAKVLAPDVADWCALALFGDAGQSEHFAISHHDQGRLSEVLRAAAATGITVADLGWAARRWQGRLTGRTTIAAMLGVDPSRLVPAVSSAALEAPLGASLIVPMENQGEALGALVLGTDDGRELDEEDLGLAVEVARRTALAVVNARAFHQEREIAETLQRALLPTTIPAVDGLDLAVRYLPATHGASVGGDWYDVLILDEDTTGIVIGDTVGHDVSASTSMGQLRSALRVVAHDGYESPGLTLSRVDRAMGSLGLTYATCIFGVLDRPSSTLRWSNAGHPPPVLVREGSARLLDGASGIMLGVTDGVDGHDDSITLQADDVLVLYTDGLVERRGATLDAGFEHLREAAVALAGRSAEEVCEGLVNTLLAGSGREDDVAILVARVVSRRERSGAQRLTFDAAPESVGRARRFARDVLMEAGWGAQVDLAALLVSELVTNAVRHAGGRGGQCAITISFDGDRAEVAVEDGDPRHPVHRAAGPLDEGGRGLYLVDTMADEWGTRPAGGGKAVWFALGTDPSEQP